MNTIVARQGNLPITFHHHTKVVNDLKKFNEAQLLKLYREQFLNPKIAL
jgi:hypothetical protein